MKRIIGSMMAVWAICGLLPVYSAEHVWIEGEAPASCNVQANLRGWGNTNHLSGGTWLSVTLAGDELKAAVPAEGVLLAYAFPVAVAGRYEVWNRVAFESVRSPFQWRVDGGAWRRVEPTELTTDLVEMAFWCALGWLRMGEVELAAGRHTLDIQPLAAAGGKKAGGEEVIRYASDAIVVSRDPFRPHGRFRPDEAWQTDADREAERHLFAFPEPGEPGTRTALTLAGPWQIARFDEAGLVADRVGPIRSLPAPGDLFWSAIAVPGDRNALRPDLEYAHRFFYRTRVNVPAGHAGQSFVLRLNEYSMLASVFVNGRLAGHGTVPAVAWDCDVTSFVKPGEVNDIWIGIKDRYYALAGEENCRLGFHRPTKLMDSMQSFTAEYDFPMKGYSGVGLLDDVELIAAGPARVEDVFVRTSVANRMLAVDVTVTNTRAQAVTLDVACEIAGAPLRIPSAALELPPGGGRTVTLSAPWPKPRLWWPANPHLYELVARVSAGGRTLDTLTTRFGFHEWTLDGERFRLNGVPWPMRADLTWYNLDRARMLKGATPELAVREMKANGLTMFRLRFQNRWGGMAYKDLMSFFDAQGVPVRCAASEFDGQHNSYALTIGPRKEARPNAPLFDRWREQMRARVRQLRNHPCVFVWELDNEIVYINGRTQLPLVEPEFAKAAAELAALDPTRATVSGGGNALNDQSLPTYGAHYLERDAREYPDEAYTFVRSASQEGRPYKFGAIEPGRKPIFLSEATTHPQGAGGNTVNPVYERFILSSLVQGYRYRPVGAYHLWSAGFGDLYRYWQPVAVLCRNWNGTFNGGTRATRRVKVFNETHAATPINVAWELSVDGKPAGGARQSLAVPPGEALEVDIDLDLPAVAARTRGEWRVSASRGGEELFRDTKELWLLPKDAAPKPALGPGELVVLDPAGTAAARLKERGIPAVSVAALGEIPAAAKVVVVGKDAVTAEQCASRAWTDLAGSGKRVVVLEQANPLRAQAVPADLKPTDFTGRFALPENLAHPAFDGLGQTDFMTWSGDHVVYRGAYVKATRGAVSLLRCDNEMRCSALSECPVNEGLLVLCQAAVGEKLATDAVAQRLFDNLVSYAAGYKLLRRPCTAVVDKDSEKLRLLDAIALKYGTAPNPVAALEGGAEIVIVDATPANLAALAARPETVAAFTGQGKWLMLWGVAPEGLAAFNRLVGIEHLIRPFRVERVALAAEADPLAAGLSDEDVTLKTAEKCQEQGSSETFRDENMFTHIVDLDDIAPFCEFPPPAYWNHPDVAGPKTDNWPLNMVNGLTRADHWKYVFSIHLQQGDPVRWEITLPREEEVTGFSIVPNSTYHELTSLRLTFDGNGAAAETLRLEGDGRQDFALAPRKVRRIGIELLAWNERGRSDVIGIDNLWISVRRDDAFRARVVPLLNIGALVKYPQGKGGIVLNQLAALPAEAVPANLAKKKAILAALLRNLGAEFSSGRVIASDAAMRYAPVPLGKQANLYLTSAAGWPDKARDLSHLPLGEQTFAKVTYDIYDFKTSPLESAVTLKAAAFDVPKATAAVTGIEVGRKADALYFLHTFLQAKKWSPPKLKKGGTDVGTEPPVAFRYVVHYADGSTVDVPVRLTVGVGNWLGGQEREPLAEAVPAWSGPAGSGKGRDVAVIYEMPWTNPRPDAAIRSIDLRYGPDGDAWGAPVVLAITSATCQ